MDVRFAKDAMVMITCSPSDYNEYLQMLGRSSRSRNMCEGILYSPTSEKPGQILERLKRANISLMLDLERLVKLLEEKRKDKQLLARLKEQEEIC